MGDALRAIDSKGCISSDFILLSGDTVTNMNLEVALREHKARREADRNAIMTLASTSTTLKASTRQNDHSYPTVLRTCIGS